MKLERPISKGVSLELRRDNRSAVDWVNGKATKKTRLTTVSYNPAEAQKLWEKGIDKCVMEWIGSHMSIVNTSRWRTSGPRRVRKGRERNGPQKKRSNAVRSTRSLGSGTGWEMRSGCPHRCVYGG